MTFLSGLVASIAEWLLTKGFGAISTWWKSEEAQQALTKNQATLQTADQSGDVNAIQKADQDALNNSST